MKTLIMIVAALGFGINATAGAISIPGAVAGVSVPGNSALGFSFVSGPLAATDTITFTQVGGTVNDPCLQGAGLFCTNGAGVVTVAGTAPVGGGFTGGPGGFTFGSLLMTISTGATTQTEQIFATNLTNGFGSPTPPTGLTLSATSLSTLGFSAGTLSATNATTTITFAVLDTDYSNNTGAFLLTQPAGVPEPVSLLLFGSGLLAVALIGRKKLA
jgi:hypothetical protein